MSQANQLHNNADVSVTASTEGEYEHGHMLGGRYQVIDCLGRGGMGTVYRVTQIFLGKEMALKTINKHCITETAIRRFQQEAQTSFHINHPNVIDVTDFGLLDDDTPFLVMELLQGETLGDRLRHGPLSINEAIDIFIQVCFGIAHAHDLGIVHRDIKPNNIMLVANQKLGAEGSVKIVDFGIAKYSAREGGEVQALTRTGEIFGSPLYMSPEQCAGESVDHRSDIYSLGCVLFEALTGQPPCVGETALTTMMKHISTPSPRLSDVTPGKNFPAALEAILAKMMSKEPDMRYSNLGVVAHNLAALRAGGEASLAKASAHKGHELNKDSEIRISKKAFAAMLSAIAICTAVITFSAIYFGDPKSNGVQQEVAEDSEGDFAFSPVIPKKVPDKEDVVLRNADAVRRMIVGSQTELKLRQCDITADGIDEIAKSRQITLLDFRAAGLPIKHLSPLSNLKLDSLEISDSNINDEGFAQLLPQENLRYLHAAKTDLTDTSLAKIAELPKLDNLDLSWCRITDEGLSKLEKSPLRWLAINHCSEITDAGIRTLEDSNIENLELSGLNITDKTLLYLTKFKNLKHLDLGNSKFMVDDLETFCKRTKISELYLKHCTLIKPSELQQLRSEFKQISFFDNHRIKDKMLEQRN